MIWAGGSAKTQPWHGLWHKNSQHLPGEDQTLCCRKDLHSSCKACATVKVRLTLVCHGFEGLLPFAGVTCSQVFNQMAVLVRSKAHQRRKGSWSVPGLVHGPCPSSYGDPVWGAGTCGWCDGAAGKLQAPGGENAAAEICPKSQQMLFPPTKHTLGSAAAFSPSCLLCLC